MKEPGAKSSERRELGKALVAWYDQSRRDLPWRECPTPYRVWISEMMLQQTRMEVVLPRYRRFLDRFPDLEALASAAEEEVLAEWSGLGYYSRARSLHAAAREIVSSHGGEFPRDLKAARALPGIGPYTAGAVLSIAYNLPVPILDGNAARVLARVFRIGGDPRRSSTARTLRDLAARLIPRGKASRFNQALMELGALICLPARPRCGDCPLRDRCQARSRGEQARYPERSATRPAEQVFLSAAVFRWGKRYLLEQRGPDAAYLRGLWGFPTLEVHPTRGRMALRKYLERRWSLGAGPGKLLGTFNHSITYRRITLQAFRFRMDASPRGRKIGPSGAGWGWFSLDRLGVDLPASSLYLKVKRELLDGKE